MENFCKCRNHYKFLMSLIKYIIKVFENFKKIDSKTIKTKNQYGKLESQYKGLKQAIKSILLKGLKCISLMNECLNIHKEEEKEINDKLNIIKYLSERIEYYHELFLKDIPDELEEYSYEEEENSNNINNEEEEEKEPDYSNYKNVNVKNVMKNDQVNIEKIKNLLENEELKKINEEEKKEIEKLEFQLLETWTIIDVELNHNKEKIDDIKEQEDNEQNQIAEGNDDHLIERKKTLSYQSGLKKTLIKIEKNKKIKNAVPGIANIIGIAFGGIIGYDKNKEDDRFNKLLKRKLGEK